MRLEALRNVEHRDGIPAVIFDDPLGITAPEPQSKLHTSLIGRGSALLYVLSDPGFEGVCDALGFDVQIFGD